MVNHIVYQDVHYPGIRPGYLCWERPTSLSEASPIVSCPHLLLQSSESTGLLPGWKRTARNGAVEDAGNGCEFSSSRMKPMGPYPSGSDVYSNLEVALLGRLGMKLRLVHRRIRYKTSPHFTFSKKERRMGVLDLKHATVSHDHTINCQMDDLEPSQRLPVPQPCRCRGTRTGLNPHVIATTRHLLPTTPGDNRGCNKCPSDASSNRWRKKVSGPLRASHLRAGR